MAAEFEAVHDIERARRMGSVHDIIPAVRLRPYLVDAVRRGMARQETGNGNGTDGRKRQ